MILQFEFWLEKRFAAFGNTNFETTCRISVSILHVHDGISRYTS
jgi:hypothetical protein